MTAQVSAMPAESWFEGAAESDRDTFERADRDVRDTPMLDSPHGGARHACAFGEIELPPASTESQPSNRRAKSS
ncbi:MAG TPA: hypothetical protein VFS32_01930 [Candidatus Limnocylindrales bacterium]|nr:hypothetical protein [Candidatus Limnocylindrales bacterium]